jgi:leucyl aminopeptidase (aminopeptidase T)
MDTRTIAMIAAAMKPYQKIGQPGETVVIITDTDTEPVIWESCAAAARAVGLDVSIAMMVPTQREYSDPPLPVQKMAEEADIVHFTTRKGLVHSQWGLHLTKLRKKRIISEGITPEMFTEGAVLGDEAEVRGWANKVQKVWDEGKIVHITSPYGSDLRVGIEGHYSFSPTGATSAEAGAELFKAPFVQFPGGECATTPEDGTGEGLLVVDQALHYPPGRLIRPVELELKGGRIVDIRGGWEADAFRHWLDSFADAEGGTICEIAVGCNPEAKFMGNMRQDRFPLGGMHIGFGMNTDVGGTVESGIHYDVILSKPTLRVDDRLIIEAGQMKI